MRRCGSCGKIIFPPWLYAEVYVNKRETIIACKKCINM